MKTWGQRVDLRAPDQLKIRMCLISTYVVEEEVYDIVDDRSGNDLVEVIG